ncbi:MAG TPA: Mu-like prophage major head subunit gpT family protein [Pirellulales bacterium]
MALNTAKATTYLNTLTAKFDISAKSYTPFYPNLCTIVPSRRRAENYTWLGAVPGIREWIGERQFQELGAATYLLKNKLWETSLGLEREDIEDDILDQYGPAFDSMGIESVAHPDELFFQVLLAAASTPCFDGQYFFDTDHLWNDSGTQSNSITVSGNTDPNNPTSTEFKKAFNAALLAMMSFKNDKGKLLNRPTLGPVGDLVVLVPPTMWQAAAEAVQAVIINNTTNVLISTPKIIGSEYLTATNQFYLFRNGGPIKPFVFQARRPVQRTMKGMDDREFRKVKFMADARYNLGYLLWWLGVLVTLS